MNFFYLYIGSILCIISIGLTFVMEYSMAGWLVMIIGFYFCIKARNKLDKK